MVALIILRPTATQQSQIHHASPKTMPSKHATTSREPSVTISYSTIIVHKATILYIRVAVKSNAEKDSVDPKIYDPSTFGLNYRKMERARAPSFFYVCSETGRLELERCRQGSDYNLIAGYNK